MSAKKLGRFTAGLLVAFGLAFGGSLLANAGGNNAAASAVNLSSATSMVTQIDYDWS
jgi:predicted alpha/beta-fold hydrolase